MSTSDGAAKAHKRQHEIIGIQVGFTVFSAVVLALRLWSRILIQTMPMGADDWTIVVAWILSLVFAVDVCMRMCGHSDERTLTGQELTLGTSIQKHDTGSDGIITTSPPGPTRRCNLNCISSRSRSTTLPSPSPKFRFFSSTSSCRRIALLKELSGA